jgi:hypothetical protein
VVLGGNRKRIRRTCLAPAPGAHPVERRSHRDLLVGQPSPVVRVAIDDGTVEADVVEVADLKVVMLPGLAPHEERLHRSRRLDQAYDAFVDHLAETSAGYDPRTAERIAGLGLREVIESHPAAELDRGDRRVEVHRRGVAAPAGPGQRIGQGCRERHRPDFRLLETNPQHRAQ